MHILFLTDNFPPEVNAPASRTFEHCREWVKAGCQVTVITCAPNFPQGKVYSGYHNWLWQRESMDGIQVIRVWTYIAANEGFAKRTLDYMSFMATGFIASMLVRRVDIIVGTSPQFFTVCAAYTTSLLKCVPWVFELRDIWPDSIRAVGVMKQGNILDILERVELFLYHKANAIISVTNAFRKSLIRRQIDGKKILVVTNGVDIDRFWPRGKDIDLLLKYKLKDKFVLGYIGTHGLAHALDTILDAAKLLKTNPHSDRYRFIFLGDGASKAGLRKRALTEKLHNIIFIDSVPKDQVAKYWSLIDVSIIHLKKDKLFNSVIPSKLFECMRMAVPVLHGVQGESAEIVKRENVGLLFEPENADELAKSIIKLANDKSLYKNLKSNGPSAAKKYSRSVLASEMLKILKDVIKTNQFSS